MNASTSVCLYCERNSDQAPMIHLKFKGEVYWICPQHLPILIHEPGKLSKKLPGMEIVDPAATHHDH